MRVGGRYKIAVDKPDAVTTTSGNALLGKVFTGQSAATVRLLAHCLSVDIRSAMTIDSGFVFAISCRRCFVESSDSCACAAYSAETTACSISAPEKPREAAAIRDKSMAFVDCPRAVR